MHRQLTNREAELLDLTRDIVHEGFSQPDAARFALSADPAPDPEFASWLADPLPY